MGTQGTVLVSSALYNQNDDQSHGALLSQNKYDVSQSLFSTFWFSKSISTAWALLALV